MSQGYTRIATLSGLPAGVYAVVAKTQASGASAPAITCRLVSSTGDFDVVQWADTVQGASGISMVLAPGSSSTLSVWVECRRDNGSGSVGTTKITAVRLSSSVNVPVNG